MSALRLIPLYNYQREHLEVILNHIDSHNQWLQFETCCRGILGKINHDRDFIVNSISKGGCAYYYAILSELRSDKDLSFLAEFSNSQSLFRHVYLQIENGTPTILSKGTLWMGNEQKCRELAKSYTPSVDIPDSSNCVILLSVENCHFHYPEISHSIKCARQTFTSPCDNCEQVLIGDKLIVKMPWTIDSKSIPSDFMHIYCLQNEDTWFYSLNDDLSQAYHELIHFS